MAKLVVEVLDACDLMPKDGQGSASPFVEIEFDEQRHRTQTKPRDLNPQWNEKLVFTIDNPRDLPNKTIKVVLYNDRKGGGHHNNFLGRVRLSGASVTPPELTTVQQPQRYSLNKRNFWPIATQAPSPQQPPVQDTNNNKYNNNFGFGDGFGEDYGEMTKKKKKKENEVRTFFSIGTGGGTPAPVPVPPPQKLANFEARADFAKAGSAATVMHMQQFPGMRPPPEFKLVETRPLLATSMGYRGGNKTFTISWSKCNSST
ncbi:hypothetical protein ACSBR2_030036 [Camellia fascicularis]